MSVSITFDPMYALPNKTVRVVVDGASGTVQRANIVSAPKGSVFYREDRSEVPLPTKTDFINHVGSEQIAFTPDVPGKYTLAILDYRLGQSSGRKRTWQGALDTTGSETLLSRTELDIYVAQKMQAKVGPAPHTLNFICYVSEDDVIETDLATYGEKTPRLEGATTLQATQAMHYLNTVAIPDGYADNFAGDLASVLDDMLEKFAEHFNHSGVHNEADETSLSNILRLGRNQLTASAVITVANKMRTILIQHMQNDDPEAGLHGGNVHNVNDLRAPDLDNVPIAPNATDIPSARVLLADLWRVFETHRQSITYHLEADTTNALDALPTLLYLDYQICSYLIQLQPSAPEFENPGVNTLIFTGGFTKLPS